MSLEFKSLILGIRKEYRGWHNFKQFTGVWPVWSIAIAVCSLPTLFAASVYGLVRMLETHNLLLIYSALILTVIGAAGIWFGLRRLACKLDVIRAVKLRMKQFSAERVEEFTQ